MEKNNHYVYRITNVVLNKHYYGARSCNIDPKDDLGKKYFSSSTDKDFKQDQKDNPQNYKYKIVKTFETRKEAVEFEILLHNKFDVGVNESFYNKAKQTSSGFDNTGVSNRKGYKHSEETKAKIGKAGKGKIISDEQRIKLSKAGKGKKRTQETKDKISKAYKGKAKTYWKITNSSNVSFLVIGMENMNTIHIKLDVSSSFIKGRINKGKYDAKTPRGINRYKTQFERLKGFEIESYHISELDKYKDSYHIYSQEDDIFELLGISPS